jgi:orotate phosphoribosyltransferase
MSNSQEGTFMKIEKANLDRKDKMANILFKIVAVKFGVFKLSTGKASPYYIDLRVVPSFPDAFREICDFYADYITQNIGLNNFDRIAGIPLAGIPFATQIAYNLKKPCHADNTPLSYPTKYDDTCDKHYPMGRFGEEFCT